MVYLIVACEPGSWSLDGTPDCSQCPVGTYSDKYGVTLCKKCEHSLSTENEGVKEESQCRGNQSKEVGSISVEAFKRDGCSFSIAYFPKLHCIITGIFHRPLLRMCTSLT